MTTNSYIISNVSRYRELKAKELKELIALMEREDVTVKKENNGNFALDYHQQDGSRRTIIYDASTRSALFSHYEKGHPLEQSNVTFQNGFQTFSENSNANSSVTYGINRKGQFESDVSNYKGRSYTNGGIESDRMGIHVKATVFGTGTIQITDVRGNDPEGKIFFTINNAQGQAQTVTVTTRGQLIDPKTREVVEQAPRYSFQERPQPDKSFTEELSQEAARGHSNFRS